MDLSERWRPCRPCRRWRGGPRPGWTRRRKWCRPRWRHRPRCPSPARSTTAPRSTMSLEERNVIVIVHLIFFGIYPFIGQKRGIFGPINPNLVALGKTCGGDKRLGIRRGTCKRHLGVYSQIENVLHGVYTPADGFRMMCRQSVAKQPQIPSKKRNTKHTQGAKMKKIPNRSKGMGVSYITYRDVILRPGGRCCCASCYCAMSEGLEMVQRRTFRT